MSELTFTGAAGGVETESRAERAERYRKEAEKYAKLAASGPQDMMNDVHRRLAERYKRMASDLERREIFTNSILSSK
jgi:hypothetical protein